MILTLRPASKAILPQRGHRAPSGAAARL